MKRRELDWQIDRLREAIPKMKPRSIEFYTATERLRMYVIERMRRDQNNAKRNHKRAA